MTPGKGAQKQICTTGIFSVIFRAVGDKEVGESRNTGLNTGPLLASRTIHFTNNLPLLTEVHTIHA